MGNAIEVQDLFLIQNDRILLNRVSFSIPESGISAFVGANASGKSALIRVLGGIDQPTEGKATVFGLEVRKNSKKIQKLIGISPEENNTTPMITVRKHLELVAGVYGLRGKRARIRIDELMEEFGLFPFADRNAADLSGGYRKRLSIAMALVHSPKILFLDEPTEGLDAVACEELKQKIRLLGKKMTVIFSGKQVNDALEIAERAYLFSNGVLRGVKERGTD